MYLECSQTLHCFRKVDSRLSSRVEVLTSYWFWEQVYNTRHKFPPIERILSSNRRLLHLLRYLDFLIIVVYRCSSWIELLIDFSLGSMSSSFWDCGSYQGRVFKISSSSVHSSGLSKLFARTLAKAYIVLSFCWLLANNSKEGFPKLYFFFIVYDFWRDHCYSEWPNFF